jgi:hypothetical protein
MGRVMHHHQNNKAMSLPPRGPTRIKARTLMERRQSPSLLCLIFCKSGGLVSYKRAFVTKFPFIYLLRAHTLFLTREARKDVRFLVRRSPYNPEAST